MLKATNLKRDNEPSLKALCSGLDSLSDFGELFDSKKTRIEYTRLRNLFQVCVEEAALQALFYLHLTLQLCTSQDIASGQLNWAFLIGFYDSEFGIAFMTKYARGLRELFKGAELPKMTLYAPARVCAQLDDQKRFTFKKFAWNNESVPQWGAIECLHTVGQELFFKELQIHVTNQPLLFSIFSGNGRPIVIQCSPATAYATRTLRQFLNSSEILEVELTEPQLAKAEVEPKASTQSTPAPPAKKSTALVPRNTTRKPVSRPAAASPLAPLPTSSPNFTALQKLLAAQLNRALGEKSIALNVLCATLSARDEGDLVSVALPKLFAEFARQARPILKQQT